MKNKTFDLNKLFVTILILTGTIYSMPSKILMAVYTPSYIGWGLIIFLIPSCILMLVWLSILDLKNKNIISFLRRILIVLLISGLSFGFKYLTKYY